MPTSSEKRALLFLASLAALGLCVRGVRGAARGGDGSGAALDRQIAAVDSATVRGKLGKSERAARKRTGSALRRSGHDTLERSDVLGDPPSRAARPAPEVADPFAAVDRRRREVAEANRASQQRFDEMTSVIAVTPQSPTASRGVSSAKRSPVDLDTEDAGTIASVPWIGPTLAARIVRERTERGTFGSLEGLQRVAGIGPGLAARIAPHVRFSGSGLGPTKFIQFRKLRR